MQVYQAVLESQASFYTAQRIAMRNATDNAGELITGYTLSYNKARQSGITSELLDIAGGAEALRQVLKQNAAIKRSGACSGRSGQSIERPNRHTQFKSLTSPELCQEKSGIFVGQASLLR